jgi:hypothetical protein
MELQNHCMDRTASTESSTKARYNAPSLKAFGLVRDLTATGSKNGIEQNGNQTGGSNFP